MIAFGGFRTLKPSLRKVVYPGQRRRGGAPDALAPRIEMSGKTSLPAALTALGLVYPEQPVREPTLFLVSGAECYDREQMLCPECRALLSAYSAASEELSALILESETARPSFAPESPYQVLKSKIREARLETQRLADALAVHRDDHI